MSTHNPHPSLACFDLKTTGLDEQTGLVLEVAAKIVTNDLSPVDDGISLVVAQHARASSIFPVFPRRGRMNEYVTDMHIESGLTREVDQATLFIYEVEACRRVPRVARWRGSAPVGRQLDHARPELPARAPAGHVREAPPRSIDLTSVEQFLTRQMGITLDRVAPTTAHCHSFSTVLLLALSLIVTIVVSAVL